MTSELSTDDHSFHIPVMGIGFTIDSPIRMAPLGLDSAISLVSDSVAEAARIHHSKARLLPYTPIKDGEARARSRRFTEYLNLVDKLVKKDTERFRASSFDDPKGIRRYFELLPDSSPKRKRFLEVEALEPGAEKELARDELRKLHRCGSIGVNIMTKLDSAKDEKGRDREAHDSDAQAALRGFAESTVEGALIFSAGANPGLFAYMAEFEDFFPDETGRAKKTIILKVSDFRSAHVQGRMLSRRGLWVAEHRIESGLNCGGHAFPTEGVLMGPILQEFAERRGELAEGLFKAYHKGLVKRGLPEPREVPRVKITAQGGIGTRDEDEFLRREFKLDGTGWGSPFLMVPEVVVLEQKTKESLEKAKPEEVKLTWSSPLGVRFWFLTTCGSEEARQDHIASGYSGSICTKRHIALNDTYGKVPLCRASRPYQKKLRAELDPHHPDYALRVERLEAPACICVDLCGSFLAATESEESPEPPPSAICPGPNVVNFQKELKLEELVDHIYGRQNVITREGRPHVFVREVELYLEVFEDDLRTLGTAIEARSEGQLDNTLTNLMAGLDIYESLSPRLPSGDQEAFLHRLASLRGEIDACREKLVRKVAIQKAAAARAACAASSDSAACAASSDSAACAASSDSAARSLGTSSSDSVPAGPA